MAARWYPIHAQAHAALTRSTAYAGPRVTITDQLGPDVWPKVKTVLEKLGAVYAVGTSAFDFEPDQDAHTLVSDALAAGRVMADANAAGYVPTPAGLADDLVRSYGELSAPRGRRLRVLEPSAGTGRFVEAITRGLGPEWLDLVAVESDTRRARQIPAGPSVSVVVDTFEAYAARARATGDRFDVVIMNPPFAVPGRAYLWAGHLMAAWELLAPGGRLVAIVPASVLDRRRAGMVGKAAALVHTHGYAEELPRDAFAESGVMVPTAVVWLDRPLTDTPAELPAPVPYPYVFRAYTGAETPVPVSRPLLTRGAALTTPVQVWRDAWRGGRERVLRYRAECVTCARPVWGFDDGENDPRGVLGDQSAAWSLDPNEYGAPAGMPVGLCAICGNEREPYERALTRARAVWAPPVSPAAPVRDLRAERTEMLGELVDGCTNLAELHALALELRGHTPTPPVTPAPAKDGSGWLDVVQLALPV
jgi:hypothetical protein